MRAPKQYALYRGDEFIDVGTADEIAKRQGMSANHIKWLSTPKAHRSGRKLLSYKLEIEGEVAGQWA